MEYLAVLVAAAGAYAFGAVWYMINAKAWMAASGIESDENGKPVGGASVGPFIISAIMVILVAGMMRHIFVKADMDTLAEGFMGGGGLGLFVVAPWIVTNYAYSMRPRNLTLIDGAYAVIGCTIIGIILTLF
jgi:hypothetical protein